MLGHPPQIRKREPQQPVMWQHPAALGEEPGRVGAHEVLEHVARIHNADRAVGKRQMPRRVDAFDPLGPNNISLWAAEDAESDGSATKQWISRKGKAWRP